MVVIVYVVDGCGGSIWWGDSSLATARNGIDEQGNGREQP